MNVKKPKEFFPWRNRKDKNLPARLEALEMFRAGRDSGYARRELEKKGIKIHPVVIARWIMSYRESPEYLTAQVKVQGKAYGEIFQVAPEVGLKDFLQRVVNLGFGKLKDGSVSVGEALKAAELMVKMQSGSNASPEDVQKQLAGLFGNDDEPEKE